MSLAEAMKAPKAAAEAPPDMVNHPPHYQGKDGIQSADVLDWIGFGPHLWNAGKYLLRAGKKGSELEDLGKAEWYLKRAIKQPAMQSCKHGTRVFDSKLANACLKAFGNLPEAFGILPSRAVIFIRMSEGKLDQAEDMLEFEIGALEKAQQAGAAS
jgi:hypothetical protein